MTMRQFILAFFGQEKVQNMRIEDARHSEYTQARDKSWQMLSELQKIIKDTDQAKHFGQAIRGDDD